MKVQLKRIEVLAKDRSLGKKRYWFGQKVKVQVESREVLLKGGSLAPKNTSFVKR